MQTASTRRSVDLSPYPDLTVIYLGFRVRSPRGWLSVLRIGRGLRDIVRTSPEGLLSHEWVAYGWNHIGMRQYWRDMDSLERFTRTGPHKGWWKEFARLSEGAGFWHETYRKPGGMEAIYINMPGPVGFGAFAEARAPEGPFMSAAGRLAA